MPRARKTGGCPHCGSAKGFERKVYPKGYYIHRGGWDSGDESMEDDSNVQYIGSRNVKCVECGLSTRWPLGRVNDFTNDVIEARNK